MIGLKVTTEPIVYEMEVIKLDKPLKPEYIEEFKEWLSHRYSDCSSGLNHEYFCPEQDYNEDIGVSFIIRTK